MKLSGYYNRCKGGRKLKDNLKIAFLVKAKLGHQLIALCVPLNQ